MVTARQGITNTASPGWQGTVGRRGLLFGGLSFLGGCAALKPAKQTMLVVNMVAGANINPSPTGVPSPLMTRIYMLRSDVAFLQGDAFSLYGDDTAILGADMLSRNEYMLSPSARLSVSLPTPPEATVLGIVAGFRELDIAHWRVTAPVASTASNIANVTIDGVVVEVQVQAKSGFWFL